MLRIETLSVRFRQHDGSRLCPLYGVTLSLARGEVVGLVGGSGAGKSLITEAMCGLLPRNAEVSGRVTIDGRALRPGDIALAPQGIDALDPLARIGAQIERFARLAGRRENPTALADSLALPHSALRAWPHEVSGGMAKRALIATALASGAAWLVADEPTLGLDPETADRIMDLLSGLASAGIGVLLISHDLPRLVERVDRVTILREGRMVETAPSSAFRAGMLNENFSRDLWAGQTWSTMDTRTRAKTEGAAC